jgi:hypothetical protein
VLMVLSDCLVVVVVAVGAGDLAIASFHIPGVVKDDAGPKDGAGGDALDASVDVAGGAAGDDVVDGTAGKA